MRFLIFNTVVIAALILLFTGGTEPLKQAFQSTPEPVVETHQAALKTAPSKPQKSVEIEPVEKFQDRLEAEVKARLEKAMKKLEEQKAASLDKANQIVERAAQKVQQAEQKASQAQEEASVANAKMAALEAKLQALEEALKEAEASAATTQAVAQMSPQEPVTTTVTHVKPPNAAAPLDEVEVAAHQTVPPQEVSAPPPRQEMQVAAATPVEAVPDPKAEPTPTVTADGELMQPEQRQKELQALVGNLEDLYARFTLR